MHSDHAVFIAGLEGLTRVSLEFFSKEDGHNLVRWCAPMDYGPSRTAHDKSDRYFLWDYDSDTVRHTLPLLPNQVVSITASTNTFDPAEFVTWDLVKSPWHYHRDWGLYS